VRYTTVLLATVGLLGLTWLFPTPAAAQCGGLCLYEVGAFDNGVSAAGAGARAQDPATVLFNPAGMTRLEDTQVHMGLVNSLGSLEFNVSDKTSPSAGRNGGGNIGQYIPLAGAFVSHELTERFRVGMSFAGLWGGSANYKNSWAGRTFVTDAQLTALAIQPTVAYRVNDWLSVGGGVGAVYTIFNLEFLNSLAPMPTTIEIKDADDWGVMGAIGLLFEPSEETRIGVYWRSETALDLKGDVDLPLATNLSFDGEMNFPQGVNLSVYHQLTPKLALLGDAGWTDWSEFGYMPATVGGGVLPPVTLPIDRGWNDPWRLAAGVRYQAFEKLLVMGGFSYDSSPVKNSKRLPDIPVGEAYRFSAGAQFRAASNIELGVSYTFLWMGDMGVDEIALPPSGSVVLDGDYNPAHIHFLALMLQFRFGGPDT
jgi:long-chain fatty acid transport protein